MTIKWKKGFDPDVILGKLSAIRTLDEDKVSFSGFEYKEYIAVLKSMIEINEDISIEISHGLITTGFHKASRKSELSAKNVLYAVKKEIRIHLMKPNESFWLVTTLNVNISNELPRYHVNGCVLCFYRVLPKKYRVSRQAAISEVKSWLIDNDESFSYYVVAHIKEKSEHDAVEKILNAIDLLRGIWNLHINKAMVLSFGGQKKPINQVTLGALHTIHDKYGDRTTGTFWYEPDYYKNHKLVDLSKNTYITLEYTKNVRKALKKSSYGKEVEIAIVRYVRALDSKDYNSGFIKLWSVLEYLTSTLRDGYDKTIKRTSFQFEDWKYNKQVLEHLRQCRNRTVHLGSEENNIETHIYQLKSYVEQLLFFHIANKFKFKSLREAAEFTDLFPDAKKLKKKIALYQDGVKFLGG